MVISYWLNPTLNPNITWKCKHDWESFPECSCFGSLQMLPAQPASQQSTFPMLQLPPLCCCSHGNQQHVLVFCFSGLFPPMCCHLHSSSIVSVKPLITFYTYTLVGFFCHFMKSYQSISFLRVLKSKPCFFIISKFLCSLVMDMSMIILYACTLTITTDSVKEQFLNYP